MDFTNAIRAIKIEPGNSLLGVQPIVSMFFSTDDAIKIQSCLFALNDESIKILIESIKNTLINPSYPYEDSVWQYNDPLFEIELFEKALIDREESAIKDVLSIYSTFESSFPFIEVSVEPLLEDSVVPFKGEPLTVSQDSPQEAIENPSQISLLESKQNSTTILLPTIALGSLYWMNRLINKGE